MADEPVVQTPPAPAIQPGPWEQDIRQAFTDPQTAAQVDQFLRARVQPRVTQLEQQYAQTEDARNLWDSFHNDPVATYNSVAQQLREAGYLEGEAQAGAQAAYEQAMAQPAPPAQVASSQTEDPRVAEMYAAWKQQQELEAYDAEIARIVNDPANKDLNPNRLHTYVSAANGDFTQAVAMYRADTAQVLADYGIDPATATPQQQEAAAAVAEQQAGGAPAVMGQGAGGAGAPVPTQPDYRAEGLSPMDALHRAIEDAAHASVRGSQPAPPVV
ncbi:MAG: hypothetical protein ACXVHB_05955 [Solirubrobacteraceae bacterium]